MLDEMSWGIAALAWAGWLVMGNARSRLSSSDRNEDAGTFGFALGTLLVGMATGVVLAITWPAGSMPGSAAAWRIGGGAVAALGVALREWAIRTLGASFTQLVTVSDEQSLVTSGPYRYVRHPGYAGTILTLIGLGMTLGNAGSVLALGLAALVAHLPRMRVEERALEKRFGDRYRAFARDRQRLIPHVW